MCRVVCVCVVSLFYTACKKEMCPVTYTYTHIYTKFVNHVACVNESCCTYQWVMSHTLGVASMSISIYTYMHLYLYMYVYIYIFMYVCIYIYIYDVHMCIRLTFTCVTFRCETRLCVCVCCCVVCGGACVLCVGVRVCGCAYGVSLLHCV